MQCPVNSSVRYSKDWLLKHLVVLLYWTKSLKKTALFIVNYSESSIYRPTVEEGRSPVHMGVRYIENTKLSTTKGSKRSGHMEIYQLYILV